MRRLSRGKAGKHLNVGTPLRNVLLVPCGTLKFSTEGDLIMYIIKNSDGKYFEQDFAGWSWQVEYRHAYKFKSLHEAEYAMTWLSTCEDICEMILEEI
jgi:hypothetical protein